MALTVYYLDDEAELCDVFKDFLSSAQIHVTTFTESEAAIEQCAQNKPDIIFIDYRLTNTTGNLVANVLDDDIEKILVTGELDLPQYDVFSQVMAKPYSLMAISQMLEAKNEHTHPPQKGEHNERI